MPRLCLPVLAALGTLISGTAFADPLSEPLLTAPAPGGAIRITPLVTLPVENNGSGAPSGVEYVLPIAGTSTLFATSTSGTIFRTDTAGDTPSVYLNLASPGTGAGFSYLYGVVRESGLSGVAFNPNFDGDPTKPGYGVFYTASTIQGTPYAVLGGGTHTAETVIQEWTTTNPNSATFSGTSRVVMALAADTASHNVGTIAFNPTAKPGSADYGMLYIASGDDQNPAAGSFYDPQSLASPGGKILRIDPTATATAAYSVPTDNPYVNTPGALPEVWASGLRNPQSFSWDSATGQMYIDDIGENSVEEVNAGKAGANYGWPDREGPFASDGWNVYPLPADDASFGYTYPIAGYDHTQGNAIGPGFVYHGSAIPFLDGMYVFSDFPNGELFYFNPADDIDGTMAQIYSLEMLDSAGNPECFCEVNPDYGRVDLRLGLDANGELIAVAKSTGDIYELTSVDVAEPASLLLLATAAGALAGGRRRRYFQLAR